MTPVRLLYKFLLCWTLWLPRYCSMFCPRYPSPRFMTSPRSPCLHLSALFLRFSQAQDPQFSTKNATMATPLENPSGQNPKTQFPSLKFSNDYPPRQTIKKFWKKFTIKSSGKPFAVLPNSSSPKPKTAQAPTETVPVLSYGEAAAGCKTMVEKIVRDCRRMNQKYKDPDFDIEFDLREKYRIKRIEDCLVPLGGKVGELSPGSVKRVEVSAWSQVLCVHS